MKKIILKLAATTVLSTGVFYSEINSNEVNAETQSVERISGVTRYDTAAKISQKSFEKADTVVIANAMNFADALAGVPLAYQKEAPILLAKGDSLRKEVKEEIARLGSTKAIILGGEFAISDAVEKELKKSGLETNRLAGKTRFETAEIIAEELVSNNPSNEAVVVDGYNFADAMSVAPFAAQKGIPIYLTRPNNLPNKLALEQFDKTIIVGGRNAVSWNVENFLNNPTRLAGQTRYETNLNVLEYFNTDSSSLLIATGNTFADALTGSLLAANNDTGIALVNIRVSDSLHRYLLNGRHFTFSILGGEAAVSNTFDQSLGRFLDSYLTVSNETGFEEGIPFKTVERKTDELLIGKSRVVQEGRTGRDEIEYLVTYLNNKIVKREEINRVRTEPIDKIVEIGTQIIPETLQIMVPDNIKTVDRNEVVKLSVETFPEGSSHFVEWSSSKDTWSHNNITKEGEFLSERPGKHIITAVSKYDESVKATYVINVRDNYEISRYDGNEKSVNIPGEVTRSEAVEINNYKFNYKNFVMNSTSYYHDKEANGSVVTIQSSSFEDKGIEEVTIPDTVTTIKYGAFSENNLKEITLPKNLTKLNGAAFYNNLITNVNFNEKLEKIGNYTFRFNRIQNLQLPDTIVEIGEGAFDSNYIENLVIPSKVTSIGSYAFSNNKIVNLSLPVELSLIGAHAFSGNMLTSISLPDQLNNLSKGVFSSNNLRNITIPSDVKIIEERALASNNLSEIYLNEGLVIIDKGAFQHNDELQQINLPSTLETIGEKAFYDTSIEEISFPETLKTIYYEAFNGGSKHIKLKKITIGNDVNIMDGMIDGTNNFREVYEQYGAGTYTRDSSDQWSKVD